MLDKDIKEHLTRKEIATFYILFILGLIILYIPYAIIILALFFILSPLVFFMGEVPDWLLEIRDFLSHTYFRWLREHYRQKAV